MQTKSSRSIKIIFWIILPIALVITAVLAVAIGSIYIAPQKIWGVLWGNVNSKEVEYIIVMNMRLTRVIASIFGGGALALSGYLFQVLFKNPIADPYVLGISSGSRLFVGLVLLGGITFGFSPQNPWFLFVGALLGAFLVMAIVLFFAKRVHSAVTLLIVGAMLSYLCSALVGILVAFSDDSSIADFTRWGMGSFGLMTWPQIRVLVIVCIIFFTIAFLMGKALNTLLLGESYASTMGIHIYFLRILIIIVAGVLTAVVTAFAGIVAFVGMSVPHICRLILKTSDARQLIPATILVGGLFGVFCDLIARTVAAPGELAVGTITSLIGVPIVLFLLTHRNEANG